MKLSKVRIAVIAIVYALLSLGIVFGVNAGTLCGLGIGDIAALCPLGALLTIVSSRTFIPRAVLSLVIAAVLVFLLGRAFCGWLCPVSLWKRVVEFFRPAKKRREAQEARAARDHEIAAQEIAAGNGSCSGACSACKHEHHVLDSRHAVLGGTLIASLACGFPVFCLVCPVGLSFAVIALLFALFGLGDLSWGLLFAPAMLVLEVVVLRKWCSRICPISALLNLVSRFSKTAVPRIDDTKCVEKVDGVACSRCATTCDYGVNLRHPEYGELSLGDCSRCMECVDVCPAQAISIRPIGFTDRQSLRRKPSNRGQETSQT